jgi:hypothetical protein
VGSLLWIGAGWLGLDVLVLAYLVLAGRARGTTGLDEPRRWALGAAATAGLCVALGVAAEQSTAAEWSPPSLVALLALLALASDLLPVRTAVFRVSGSTVAILLALVVLGPAPAVGIGMLGTLVDAARNRPPRLHLLANLMGYATFPLVGAVALDVVGRAPLAVFVVAISLSLVNFVLVGGFARLLRGGSMAHMLRRTWLPVLPWELATAGVVAATALAVGPFGYAAIAVLALSLVALQLMLRSLLHHAAGRAEMTTR